MFQIRIRDKITRSKNLEREGERKRDVCVCVSIYIYIYIERERERERERDPHLIDDVWPISTPKIEPEDDSWLDL